MALSKEERQTLQEVLDATNRHFSVICDEDNSRLQDVVDGMDISISKLRSILAMNPAKAKPLKVKKWYATGELTGKPRTQAEILEQCGNALDRCCSHEILGDVVFKATNGKYYTVTVEAVISECDASLNRV